MPGAPAALLSAPPSSCCPGMIRSAPEAEQATPAAQDVQERNLLGFGCGAASVEYEGFRVPMEEARPRFVEAAEIVVKALSHDSFDYDGEFYRIPRTAIRPRPISD